MLYIFFLSFTSSMLVVVVIAKLVLDNWQHYIIASILPTIGKRIWSFIDGSVYFRIWDFEYTENYGSSTAHSMAVSGDYEYYNLFVEKIIMKAKSMDHILKLYNTLLGILLYRDFLFEYDFLNYTFLVIWCSVSLFSYKFRVWFLSFWSFIWTARFDLFNERLFLLICGVGKFIMTLVTEYKTLLCCAITWGNNFLFTSTSVHWKCVTVP